MRIKTNDALWAAVLEVAPGRKGETRVRLEVHDVDRVYEIGTTTQIPRGRTLAVGDHVALASFKQLTRSEVRPGEMLKEEMHEWIMHNLDLVHMSHAWNKRPHEISGGMKQRVGIARALAMEPAVLLMDEPFGALDALTRAHLQDAVMEIQTQLNTTIVLITHDVDEAVLLSDRVMMMTNGPAAKVGEVLEVTLPRPRSRLALANDAQFHHYRQQVLHFLHEKHKAVA